jgi:hypothetical protein
MQGDKEVNPISEYLDSIGVGYRTRKGGTFDYKNITFGYTGKNTSIDCSIDFAEGGKVFTVFGMVPNKVPKDFVKEAMKIINYANWGGRYGTMIINPKDGKFWARHSNASVQTVDSTVYDAMINNVCSMMDEYYPLIMKIIYGEKTAEEVIIDFENSGNDDKGPATPTDISGYQ